jgi:3-dehydroquinate dehydratase / shikimate dehydrogenase
VSAEPTRIVASVAAATRAEAVVVRAAVKAAGDVSDWIELRADGWRESAEKLHEAVAMMDRPVIVTVRSRHEGGAFEGGEAERRKLLAAAARSAAYVDVDGGASFAAAPFAPARTIVSSHDFNGMPADLDAALAALRAAAPGAAYCKLAVTPASLADVARLVGFARRVADSTPPLALIAMGEYGRPLRALAGKLGCPIAYGHVPAHTATAEGQWSIVDLAANFAVRSQTASTPVLAVVGNPIGHSLSPLLHNTLLRASGQRHVFVPILADKLDEALALAAPLDLKALSVTLPFKIDAVAAATGPAPGFPWPPPEGSVNTLLLEGSSRLAANTDRIGFLAALASHAPPATWRGRAALVIGSGGVARTGLAVLKELGAKVTIASRDGRRAQRLADEFGAAAVGLATITERETRSFELIVNATPAGMHPEVSASPLDGAALSRGGDGALRRGQVVLDLVYRPRRTRLLLQAARAGAVAIGGFEMFLAQALAQFRLFTGVEPDAALARAALERALDA